MQIVVKEENKESIYDVIYDEETVKHLISDIITNCSIRRRRKYCISARTQNEAENIINSATDWNGNKLYENVSDIREEPIYDPNDYWRHGDPSPYSFISDALIAPQLASFLINMLNGKSYDHTFLTERKELFAREKLQSEIESLDTEINGISNFDTDKKISKLNDLARKTKRLSEIPDFDYETLVKYYSIAEECIDLELVQETIKYQKKKSVPNPNKQ